MNSLSTSKISLETVHALSVAPRNGSNKAGTPRQKHYVVCGLWWQKSVLEVRLGMHSNENVHKIRTAAFSITRRSNVGQFEELSSPSALKLLTLMMQMFLPRLRVVLLTFLRIPPK